MVQGNLDFLQSTTEEGGYTQPWERHIVCDCAKNQVTMDEGTGCTFKVSNWVWTN